MIGEDCDRLLSYPRDKLGTNHTRACAKKTTAEKTVNPTDERIGLPGQREGIQPAAGIGVFPPSG